MLKLGYACCDITPAEAVPLMGYGDRTHPSTGVHDPLYACAWYVQAAGGQPVVWVVLDLCLVRVQTAAELAAELAGRTEVPVGRILISTTHTHSGPDVRVSGSGPQEAAERYYRRLVDGAAEAVLQARSRAFTGSVEVRLGSARIGVNRRDSRLPVDPRVVLLSLVDAEGRLRALLFHYSCHLTALGVDNYLISADWLAPVRRTLQAELGVPVGFLQGAEGNVDPYTRGELDMADPDQALGVSFQEVERPWARSWQGPSRRRWRALRRPFWTAWRSTPSRPRCRCAMGRFRRRRWRPRIRG